jgi:hypothetical protein
MPMPKPPEMLPPSDDKARDAEVRFGQWLAHSNELSEMGYKKQAEKAYHKSQFWLDRANKLRGWD